LVQADFNLFHFFSTDRSCDHATVPSVRTKTWPGRRVSALPVPPSPTRVVPSSTLSPVSPRRTQPSTANRQAPRSIGPKSD